MAKYYILIKKSGSKNWLGAIPVKKGVTLARLRKGISGQIKKGYTYRVITSSQLKTLLKKRLPKTSKRTTKRRTVKRKTTRRKVRRRKAPKRRKKKR